MIVDWREEPNRNIGLTLPLQILSYRSWDWVRWPGVGVVRRLLLLLEVMSSLAEILCLHSQSLLDCWTPRIFSKGEILYPRPRQPVGEGTWRRFCCRARPSWPGGSRAVPGDPAITKISIMSTYSVLPFIGQWGSDWPDRGCGHQLGFNEDQHNTTPLVPLTFYWGPLQSYQT